MLAVRDDVEAVDVRLVVLGALVRRAGVRPAVDEVRLAVARVDRVASAVAAEDVVSAAAVQPVRAGAARDRVVAGATVQPVGPGTADETIVPVAAVERVADVRRAPRDQRVVAAEPDGTIWNSMLLERSVSGPSVP